jgi:hypothetical protein
MDKISEIITCKVCNKYFSNPVLLPCLKSVCQDHIIIESNCQIFKCKFCNKNHVSNDGFNLNKELIDLINLNLHLDENTISAKSVLDNLENVNKDIDLITKDPEDFVFNYFSEEKNKIDLKRETLFATINDISDKMINKIQQMEIDSKSNLKDKQNLIDSNFDCKMLTERILAWKDEIRNPRLSKNRLEKIIDESSDLLKQMENQSFEFKNKILNENSYYFSPNKDEFKSDLFGQLIMPIKFDSNIVNKDQLVELIKLCEFDIKTKFYLLYRATRDGFSSQAFHLKCDDIPNTLTIIKVKNKPHIFGGYTEATWDRIGYDQDQNSFLFSLVNNDNTPIKMKINRNGQKAIYCNPSFGPIFGSGHSFYISSDSNKNKDSYSNLGKTYQHPNYEYGSNEAQSFLAGSYNFSTSEIEVFQVARELFLN